MNSLKNRKGSVIVFICIFFVSLVFMILAFADFSKKTAAVSAGKALCSLWADSVLAEYDLNLQKRYNIFGYYGSPSDVKEKIEFYAGESFRSKKYIDYRVTGCSLYDYALTNTEVMETQLASAGKLAFTEKFREPDAEIKSVTGYTGEVSRSELFENLPSEGSSKGFSVSSAISALTGSSSAGDAVKRAGNGWFISQYMFAYLKDASDEKGLGETFFENEIEYVICGQKSDAANMSRIRAYIIALREGPNLLYLNKDPVKSGEAEALALLLSPGPAAAATKQALLALWAYAESINDYNLLLRGYKVPFMKTEASWATDLESALKSQEEGCIYTGTETGEDYRDYLRLMVSVMDRNVRILRIMDLIQINMRKFYYKSFLLRDYYGGVRFRFDINGAEYETVKLYEKKE